MFPKKGCHFSCCRHSLGGGGLVVVLALAELTLVVASRGLAKMFCVASLMLNHSIVLNGSRSFSCPCLLSILHVCKPMVAAVTISSSYQSCIVAVSNHGLSLGSSSRALWSWSWSCKNVPAYPPTADDCGNVGICRSRFRDAIYAMPVCRIRGQRLH